MNTNVELQRDVKYNIYKALQRAAQVDCEQIFVEANDGQVILRGTCRSWAERGDAEQAARALPGVNYVRNEIKVTGPVGAPGRSQLNLGATPAGISLACSKGPGER